MVMVLPFKSNTPAVEPPLTMTLPFARAVGKRRGAARGQRAQGDRGVAAVGVRSGERFFAGGRAWSCATVAARAAVVENITAIGAGSRSRCRLRAWRLWTARS